ncbi:MAG: cation transporter [Chloracidobacterium sp.]|nr:cation transporter [Chloracidobacterium sp.]MDW8218006.1 cation transporter [Acidobacteriota bacterium]
MVLRRDVPGKWNGTPEEGKVMREETFEIEGMHCGHCVRAVETALRALVGVEVRRVEIGRASVAYAPETVSRARIVAAIEEAGFQVV